MKRFVIAMQHYAKPAAGLLLAAALFAACKKDEDMEPRTPVAGLMIFNAAPDQNAVSVNLSGTSNNTAPIAFNSYSGSYIPVYTGSREMKSFDYNSGTTLALSNVEFADSGYYSAFILGTNGNYRNVVVKDAFDSVQATTGKAWVRYINAIPDSSGAAPAVTIGAGGTDVINETGNYGSVSSFVTINAGQVNISVNNGENVSATRDVTLEENKVYTILLTGIPGSTNPAQAVQVKFIQNGAVTP